MRLTALLFLLLGAFTISLLGQEISTVYTQYTVEDRLHSNDINFVMQDSKGYIWFIGGRSISRFNGTEFKEIYIGGFTNRMFEDSKGKLWLAVGSNLLLVEDFALKYAEKYRLGLQKSLKGSFIHSIAEDSLGNVWYTVNNLGSNTRRGEFSEELRYITAYKMGSDSIEAINLMKDPEAYQISAMGFVKPLSGNSHIYSGTHFKAEKLVQAKQIKNQAFSNKHFIYPIAQMIQLKDGSFLARSSVELMHYNQEKIFLYDRFGLDTHITFLFQDKRENIWIGTMDGLWQAAGGDLNTLKKMDNIPKFQVTSIMEDNEGNIWISTIGGGAIKLSGSKIERLSWQGDSKKSRIADLVNHKDAIWFCNDFGSLVELDKDHNTHIHDKRASSNGFSLVSVGDTLLTAKRMMYFDGKKELLEGLEGRENLPSEYLNLMMHVGGGNIWAATTRNFFLFNLHQKKVLFDAEKEGFKQRVYCLSKDSEGTVWFGSNFLVYYIEDNKIRNAKKRYPKLYEDKKLGSIRDINWGPKDHMFLTYDRGVVIHTPSGSQIFKANIELSSSKYFAVNYLEKDTSVWISGFGGVDKFEYDNAQGRYIKTNYLGTKNGLPVVSTGRIVSFQDNICIGSSDGLYLIKSDELVLENIPRARVHITDFQVADSSYEPTKEIELSYDQNSPSFKIDGVSFQKEKEITFKYRLLGQSEEWLSTKSKDISYYDLKPGTYTFQIYGIRGDYDRIQGEESQLTTFSFSIIPHFTQTWFFITTMFTLAAILLGYAVYAFVRWKDRQDRRQMLTTELKYQALQSQMSPHFIFNAMNSISYLVKNKKSKEADKYLNKFAGLLRGVLENAQYSFITLLDEIELVQSYLELEQLQFGKQFQFSIDMDPELMAYELQLPPMLIQPIIENAIRHGISPRGYGAVKVDFKHADKNLKVSIEDDGVGRAFAKELKKQSLTHTSKTQVGIQNIRERINVLNHLYGLDMEMKIVDLEETSEATGTRVVFTFPKIKYLPEIQNSSFTSFQSFTDNSETEEYQKD